MRFTRVAALLGLSLVACRGGGGGDDVVDPDGPPVGGVVHIQDIQNDSMPKGTAVELRGVVVTAIDSFGARTGDMWVEEPGGGEFSGVKVFGAPLDQLAILQPGDIVSISNAEKDEFALTADTSGRTTTEIKGAGGGTMTITRTGPGTLPPAATVDAKAIDALADLAAKDAEWEKWEGVLINVTNARQTGSVAPFGSTPAPDATSFNATGGLVVESVLAAFPADSVAGVCYQGLTGIGDYFFDYLLLPRSDADLTTGGTGCAAQTIATVAQVQGGTATGGVEIDNVFITGRDRLGTNGKTRGLWVSDSLTAAQNTGVYVFTGSEPDATMFVTGAKVNVFGTVSEFDVSPAAGDTLTEISGGAVVLVAAPTTLPIPATTTAAVAGDITNGEPFEGVLVKFTLLKVTNIDAGQGKVELTDNTNAKVIMDNDSFDFPVEMLNRCYATVTGVMSVQLSDNVRTINPRSAGDLVVGAGCN